MANQQFIDTILNKQFKKTAFAGYDTIDVDSFFDKVIDFLKASNKVVDEYKHQLDKVIAENEKLKLDIGKFRQDIVQKDQTIAMYQSEGYGNVVQIKKVSELEQKVQELEQKLEEKGKDNGK